MAALFVVPNLETNDLALLTMVTRELPAWVGRASSASPERCQRSSRWPCSCSASARCGATRSVTTRPRRRGRVSGLAALGGALLFPDALVRLSVLSYEGIAQLVPPLVGGLLWRRMTVQGALAGLLVGEAIVVPLAMTSHDPFLGINAGLIGLVANVIVNVAVSRARPNPEDAPEPKRFQRLSEGSTMPSSSHV